MNSDDFEEVELLEDTICDYCGFTIVKGSIAHENFEDNLIYCSTCLDDLRRL